MGFDHALHRDCRDSGVNRIAARLESFKRRAGRKGMRGCRRRFPRKDWGASWCLKITIH
jgi:hypothetical protein